MIIVCSSCSAQYSVPDARVRGKLVRITCKHCATAMVVDARQATAEAESALHSALLRMPAPGQEAPDASSLPDENVTLVARSKLGEQLSVHDELTVIGRIPKEMLETERLFAQRTQPPPSERALSQRPAPAAASPERPSALPEVPEKAVDDTKAASPRAIALSHPPAAAPRSPAPPRRAPEEPTLVSQAASESMPPFRSPMARHVRVALLVVLLLAVALLIVINRMPR